MARTLLFLFAVAIVSSIPSLALAAACEPKRCGSLNISAPFGIVGGAEEIGSAQFGFQVHCTADVPYLGYYEPDVGLRILDIFYANASLLVSDVHKLGDFNVSGDCHVPTSNTASKIGHPFWISPLNQNLVFYNCSRDPGTEARERAGLVGTACRRDTFVGAGGRYRYETADGIDGWYGLPGCSTTAVPVLAAYGEVNASDYLELIREGFLLTWQPPPAGSSGE